MATDATKVRSYPSGGVFKGIYGATAPTGTAGAPTAHTDLGFLGEGGVELEVPGPGDSKPFKAWQNGTIVRVVRTPTDDLPSWTFTMLETKKETIETAFGVTVTSGATEGSFEFVATNSRPYNSYVVDYIDGAELTRDYVPKGIVTEVSAIPQNGDDPAGYEVKIEGEYDGTKLFNFKRWATALKT